MAPAELRGLRSSGAFDVVCAGEALWVLSGSELRPGGGAANVAVALSRQGLRVGLAAALADDARGRELVARIAAAGVDASGVRLGAPVRGLVVAEGAGEARRVVPLRAEDELPIAVPERWTSSVLVISGLSPALGRAAGLCKAARAARRTGAIVVVDVNARRHAWAGRDPRAVRAPLREADVVRASTADLAALGIDERALREAMRPGATLVLTHGAGPARAAGAFGEIAVPPPAVSGSGWGSPRGRDGGFALEAALRPGRLASGGAGGAGDAFTAAICLELARAGDSGDGRPALWERALARGHAAARSRMERIRAS